MHVSKATWTKVGLGLLAVVIIWALLRLIRGKKEAPKQIVLTTMAPSTSMPEKFVEYAPAGWEDDDEEEEVEDDAPAMEEYSQYVPPSDAAENEEQYVDAADVYSPVEFSSQLLN